MKNNSESFALINVEVKGLKLLFLHFSIFQVKEIVLHFPVLSARTTDEAMRDTFKTVFLPF